MAQDWTLLSRGQGWAITDGDGRLNVKSLGDWNIRLTVIKLEDV